MNRMCKTCARLGIECNGTSDTVWTGCVYKEQLYTRDTFRYHADLIGCRVTADVVEDMVNALPPACMRSNCTQNGEPYIHRQDPDTGWYRPAFATFKKLSDTVWEFCGFCFRGENMPRGKDPVYC